MNIDIDRAAGDEICASCRNPLERDEPYQQVEYGHINVHGAPVPLVELWCLTCAWEAAA